MILDDKYKPILVAALTTRVERLALLNQALPVIPVQANITEHEELLQQINGSGGPPIQPITTRDEEETMFAHLVLSSLVDVKHYTEIVRDDLKHLTGAYSKQLINRLAVIYREFEQIQSVITEIYPQATEGF